MTQRVAAQPRRALPDRKAVVNGQRHVLGRLAAGERAEVGCTVIAHHPNYGQPGKGLVSDLDPLSAFRNFERRL